MNKICVMGLGYVGLPTALIAAERGFDVIGFDVDTYKVDRINSKDTTIFEPELDNKLFDAVSSGRFRATSVIEAADYFVIAVPTPFLHTKQADLSYVFKAADLLATVLKKGDTIILESTVPVGTTDHLADYLANKTGLKAGEDFYCAHCPERVLPGKIFFELINNHRIIGGINKISVERAKLFYKQFVMGKLYLTNATTAEMVKLVENSSRDVALAFSNQVASMAYAMGLNPYEVIELANKHPRVEILRPTCGVGGHCIAVDPFFLIETFGPHTQLLQVARQINDSKPFQVMRFIRNAIDNWSVAHVGTCKVLLLGLSYKPDIDDIRESPALFIAQQTATWQDCQIMVCEPHLVPTTAAERTKAVIVPIDQGIELADIVVCLVAHTEFKTYLDKLRAHPRVIDMCGLLHKDQQEEVSQQEHLFWPAKPTNTLTSKQHKNPAQFVQNEDF